jgi:hypothetical protein
VAKKFKQPSIKYTSRDYDSIRKDLIQHAKKYYPDSFQDFNEASFGALMVDAVSYVGDMLSFYLDYQANESFLTTANEYNNVLKHGKAMGYKMEASPSSYGTVTLFISVPVVSLGIGPDISYAPILRRGTSFRTTGGTTFMLTNDVNFADPANEITVSKMNNDGRALEYAIRAYGQVVSGVFASQDFAIKDFERFKRLDLGEPNLTEIVSVFDSEGNQWYEVDHLSQNTIYKSIINNGVNANTVPNLLKPFVVMRRFAVEKEAGRNFLQFGYGSESNVSYEGFLKPDDLVLERHARDYITDLSFDPSKLIQSDKFGLSPSNTILTVTYRVNSRDTVNTGAGTITAVNNSLFHFPDSNVLNNATKTAIIGSLEVINDEQITGDVSYPSMDEIKRRIFDTFASQNRAVTAQDYKALVYMMPPRFGVIKRCHIFQDPDAFKRNVNMYIISENSDGNLIKSNSTIKNNLKNWINQYRMINDSVDVLDTKIINIGIDFTLVAQAERDKFTILRAAEDALRATFLSIGEISEPISISDIYRILNRVDGVSDTVDVTLVRKFGTRYSSFDFNVEDNMSFDGRYLLCPEDSIFEIKYLDTDIRGTIR